MLPTTQIGMTIVIPERTRILPLGNLLQTMQRTPWTVGIFSCRHKQSFVGGTEIDIETSIVMANSRCPRSTAIVAIGIPTRIVEVVIDLTHQLPVDQVRRFQHLHSQVMEVAGHHIIFVPHAVHVWITVVGIQHRVLVRSVVLVAPVQRHLIRHLPMNSSRQSRHHEKSSSQKERSYHHDCF